MISSSREADSNTPKKEQKSSTEAAAGGKISKAAASSSSTPSWSRLKDPRIVRVSRAFGGKDRHSKVCTVRGLRDRRVRLSVPTAIQLYDLQDRLGLNQPSKVIDWLLNAAKDEIDELPPLQIPPGDFVQMLSTCQSVERSEGQLKIHGNWNNDDHLELSTWGNNSDGNVSLRDHMKSKEIAQQNVGNEKESWSRRSKQGDLDHHHHHHHQGHDLDAYISSSNFFARPSRHSNSLTGNVLNNVMPHAVNSSFLQWDPSNLSLSQTDHRHHLHNNFNVVPILPSSSLSMPSGSHQFVVYPPSGTDFDPKQMINLQMLSSATSTSQDSPLSNSTSSYAPSLYTISHAMRPFHLSMNPYNGSTAQSNKDD